MSFEQGMISAIVVLSSVIGTMALWFKSLYQKLDKRLAECERDRIHLWKHIGELHVACHLDQCPKRSGPQRDHGDEDDGA